MNDFREIHYFVLTGKEYTVKRRVMDIIKPLTTTSPKDIECVGCALPPEVYIKLQNILEQEFKFILEDQDTHEITSLNMLIEMVQDCAHRS